MGFLCFATDCPYNIIFASIGRSQYFLTIYYPNVFFLSCLFLTYQKVFYFVKFPCTPFSIDVVLTLSISSNSAFPWFF